MNQTAPRSPASQADITARVEGRTAGVVEQSGQSVFASSVSTRASKAKRGKSATRSSADSAAPAVSEGSATSEGWSGVGGTNASLASADEMGQNDGGGLSGAVMAGIAILSLGLVGIAGGALATVARRRRVAGAAKRP